jgi:regulator of replication initiation timing
MSNNQELLNKVDQLDRQLVELETNYHTIVKKNDEEMGKNRQLQQELAILNEQLRSNTAHPTGNEKELELKVA